MAAQKFTRNKDYTSDAANNTGGRSSIDAAGLDGELDEVKSVTDNHADKLDVLLRDDEQMQDDILQGHEFSGNALAFLSAFLATATSVLNWRGAWLTLTDYNTGDLVHESGNSYVCLVPHTSGVFATDLSASRWSLFAAKGVDGAPGSVGLGTPITNYMVTWNGSAFTWVQVTTLHAPTLAPVNNATLTGVTGLPDVNIAGRLNFTTETVAFSAAGNTFNFDTQFIKRVTMTANYTGACSASNITQGDVMEVHFTNNGGGDYALLWDANWRWMGYAPTILPSGKKAVLSLRAPTGSAATDIVALWSVEP